MFHLSYAMIILPLLRSTVAFSSLSHPIIVPRATFERRQKSCSLHLSNVPQENPNQQQRRKRKTSWKDLLPPAPEDQLVISGDVAALFIYSFLDHILNDAYAEMISAHDASTISYANSFDPILAGDLAKAQHIPVWFDAANSAFGPPLLGGSTLALEHTLYSPAINTAGTSAVILSTCWLLSGYIFGAFLFRNTVLCSTRRAVWTAAKAWLLACLLMVGIALGSDYFVGCVDCLRHPSLGRLTKADADFIFDSMGVVVSWRFLLNFMMGGGSRTDDD